MDLFYIHTSESSEYNTTPHSIPLSLGLHNTRSRLWKDTREKQQILLCVLLITSIDRIYQKFYLIHFVNRITNLILTMMHSVVVLTIY